MQEEQALPEEWRDKLKAAMEQWSVTPTELAAEVGVDPSFISHLLAGRRRCNVHVLLKMCQQLGLELKMVKTRKRFLR